MATKEVKILINARDQASGTFKKVAAAAAAAFSVRAVVGGIQSMADAGDDIGKQAKRIGVTAEAWQKLAFAARRTGSDQAEMETGFRRMASTIFDAEAGVKASVDALDMLGLKFSDLKGKAADEQFAIIADAMNKITDATTKSALAQDIFGRAGTKLIPLLAEYRSLADEAERLGIITNENVEAAEKFKDQLENLKTASMAFVQNSGLLKYLTEVVAEMDALIKLASGEDFSPFHDAPNQKERDAQKSAARSRRAAAALEAERAAQRAAEKQDAAMQKVWLDAMKDPSANSIKEIVLGDDKPFFDDSDWEENFGQMFSQAFDQLINARDAANRPSNMTPDRPQQAFVTRFLSGLSTTQKPAEKTADNTGQIAKGVNETVSLLGGLIEITKKNGQLQPPVLSF